MRFLTFDSSETLRALPPGRAIVLTALATLLAAADWLPDNHYVDPDHLEFVLSMGLGASAIAISLRDRMDAAALARLRLRALLLATTLTILLAGAEPITRVMFRDVTTSADNGGFFSKRWFRTGAVHLNDWQLRERQFTDAKAPGTYRIAAVGDSFTFGNGIAANDRYSALLQAQLPSHFEVLNFGMPGANTPEHLTTVTKIVPRLHPNFVLLQWYVNDVEDDDSDGRPSFAPLMPIRGLHNWLSDSSALYTVANMQWSQLQARLGFTVSYQDYLQRRLGNPDSPDSRIDRALLRELIEYCKKQGVPIGIVLFPDTAVDMGRDYPFAYLHERVLAMCEAERITCIDLRKDFAAIKDRRTLWANVLDHHPSARANAIAAERILETFSGEWAASPSR